MLQKIFFPLQRLMQVTHLNPEDITAIEQVASILPGCFGIDQAVPTAQRGA